MLGCNTCNTKIAMVGESCLINSIRGQKLGQERSKEESVFAELLVESENFAFVVRKWRWLKINNVSFIKLQTLFLNVFLAKTLISTQTWNWIWMQIRI